MYRLNKQQQLTGEQLKMIVLHKLQLEEQLRQIDATLGLVAPETISSCYSALAHEGKIVPLEPQVPETPEIK